MAPLMEASDSAAAARIAALAQYGILDTPPEPGFDDIVLLATRICETPVALVSLVTADRQWFKARIGFPACETPLSQSVCALALAQDGVMIIPDLTVDARTRDNTLVTGEPFIRFYAGALLETPHGIPIGTLCVIDTKPRPQGLTPTQIESLQALARQVVGQIELRRFILEREGAIASALEADATFRKHQGILQDERQHRLKNVVAMVQAIVLQTLKHSQTVDDARAAVSARLRALAKGQELLFTEMVEHAQLSSIVQSVAELYQTEDNFFEFGGPDVSVGGKAALAFSLIFNELATNATKYGALSAERGRVAVSWRLQPGEAGTILSLCWRERGGPPVVPPRRRGFGTTLIEQALSGGTAKLHHLPDGLECHLSAPLGLVEKG